ncbi:MAG TPA: SDR family oxidoreductase [Dongiaceae bacterium]|nr:SDR family oxidoreductase [Dongiaceae bacterium]
MSISSDIGAALAKQRLATGWRVAGTYRKKSSEMDKLAQQGAVLFPADFASRPSVKKSCDEMQQAMGSWNELIVAPGTMEPIGRFETLDFEQWAESVDINFINQLCAVHRLLPARGENAQVIFFAGAATNGTADCFSAYAISKIALIKMTELLDSEMPDVRFSIVGPGWVRTKIHQETLRAEDRCEASFQATVQHLEQDDFVAMDKVVACIDWLSQQEKAAVGGRNISTQYDQWARAGFAELLEQHADFGKLRRSGNRELNLP